MPQTQTQSGNTGYDPTSSTPYQAPQLPEITPPPIPPQTPEQPKAPTLLGGRGSGAAKVAFTLDSFLKGVARGTEQAQQAKYNKLKRLSDGLQYAYESAAQNYIELLRSGADPNSDEVKKADLAQRAAYQSLMQMRGNYILGQDSGKKSKSGKSKGGDPSQAANDPMQLMASQNPQDKIKGAYLLQQRMYQKVGTPANALATQWLTPEYRRQLDLYRGQQAATGRTQASDARFDELQKKEREGTITDPERKELEITRDQRYAAAGKLDKIIRSYPGADGKLHMIKQRPDGTTYETTSESEERGLASQGPGTLQDFIQRTAKEAGIDVKDLSAQSILDLEKAYKTGGTPVRVSQRQYVYTDKDTGDIHVVPLTTTSGPAGGTGAAKVPEVHKAGTTGASTGTGTRASTTDQFGGRIIGHTTSQPHAKSMQTVTDTYKKQKPLFDLLQSQEDYMNAVAKDPSAATPRQDLALVVAAVRSMNPGSVRLPNKELELEVKAGSYGDRVRRWYDTASTGLLPEDQRKDLFNIVQKETTKAGESIAADWQQYMSGQPLPADLKRFATSGNSGSGTGSSRSGTISPELKNKLDADFGSPNSPQ